MNNDKQKLLKKIALWDLIIFGILVIPSLFFVIVAILSDSLPREFIDKISWMSEVATSVWIVFWIVLVIMNIIYIFYFKQWKRLLYIFGSATFSAIAYAGFIVIALKGIGRTNGKLTNFELFIGLTSFFLLISIYPVVHLTLAWKNYSGKEKAETETLNSETKS